MIEIMTSDTYNMLDQNKQVILVDGVEDQEVVYCEEN